MNNLIQMLNIKGQEGLYSITLKDIHLYGGGGLLRRCNNSLGKLLTAVYPEYLTSIDSNSFYSNTSGIPRSFALMISIFRLVIGIKFQINEVS